MNNKIDFIQGLRGIAVIMVVFYHGSRFLNPSGLYDAGLGKELFGGMGSLGVVLFFIISGFIMTITTSRSDGSFRYFMEFCIKRITRVFPAYLIATLCIILATKHGLNFFSDHENTKSFLKSIFFIPHGEITAPSFGFPVLPVGWTLNFEMYFYFIFGISLMFGKARWVVFFSFIALSLCAIPLISGNETSFESSVIYNFKSNMMHVITSPMIWNFAAGSLIGVIYLNRSYIKSHEFSWMLVFASVSWVVIQYVSDYRVNHGVMGWGISLIPMFAILVIASKTVDISLPKPLIYLGNISFSLYLWHPLSQEVLPRLAASSGIDSLRSGIPAFVSTFSLAVVLASISHFLVERRLSEYLKVKGLKLLR